MSQSRWASVLLPLLLIGAPILIAALYIWRFRVNVPFWDQWVFVPLLQAWYNKDVPSFLAYLWHAQNEQRLVIPQIVFLMLLRFSRWNTSIEVWYGFCVACLSLLGIWLIYRKFLSQSLWAFVPVSWLLFNLGQGENMLWSWQLAIYLEVLGSIFALYFLSLSSPLLPIHFVLAVFFGIISSLSFTNGLLIWLVGLLPLSFPLLQRKYIFLWILSGVLVTTCYYIGYTHPSHHPPLSAALSQPLVALKFFLANVGAPLGGGNLRLSGLIGIFLVGVFSVLLCEYLAMVLEKDISILKQGDVVLVSLVLMSLLSSLAITVGRVGFGHPEWAMTSRYVTITSPGIAGIYMLALRQKAKPYRRLGHIWHYSLIFALLCIIIGGLIVTNIYGVRLGEMWYWAKIRAKYALQTIEIQPDDNLRELYPFPTRLREYVGFLREHQLSVFAEPINILLLPSTPAGVPAGEILPDRPIVQSIRCSVDALHDISVFFGTYARLNTATIEVILREGGNIIEQWSISATTIPDNSWTHFVLSRPLENCSERYLVLIVASPDAKPGNAVTVWTYPRYYDGKLLSPKEERLVNRVAGIEFNTLFYGLAQK